MSKNNLEQWYFNISLLYCKSCVIEKNRNCQFVATLE